MKSRNKDNDRTSNIIKNLNIQLDASFKHFNEGSFKTRERYHEAMARFVDFLGEKYSLQKLTNIGNKHFVAYVNNMIDRGLSTRTITTDMSGIRYFVYHTTQKELVNNSKFSLKKRTSNKYDKSWSSNEIDKAKALAKAQGHHVIYHAISVASAFGLRLEETVRLSYGSVAKALVDCELDVVGKGGQERTIYVENLEQVDALTSIAKYAKENGKKAYDKILIDRNIGSTRKMKCKIENWVKNHGSKFEDKDRSDEKSNSRGKNVKPRPLHPTFHGLRYRYANFIYDIRKKDMSDKELERYISERLGHHRAEITKIYLKYKKK